MTAFFFGPADRQLFGFYHPPAGYGSSAAVLCPSWGPEYQYAHRALRVTARRLAERGVHVLRFDYSGTGDSWGDGTDGNVDRWREDVALAVEELRAMSSVPRVDLLGLRFGAYMAASVAAGRDDVRSLVLWDPVVDGGRWLREVSAEAPRPSGKGTVEFAQRLVAERLLREFASIGAPGFAGSRADRVLLLETSTSGGDAAEALRPHLPLLEHRIVQDTPAWLEDVSIWSGMVPAKAIAAISEWMVGR